MSSIIDFDFFDPAVIEDPYLFYQTAIAQAPVYPLPGTNMFLVTGYDLVCKAADDPERFSSRFGNMMQGRAATDNEIRSVLAQGWPFTDTLITNDPPGHSRFRKLVGMAFSAPRVNAMEADISVIANELADQLAAKHDVDFVADFAVPLPVKVIGRALGQPDDKLADLKAWSDCFMDLLGGQASRARELECAHGVVAFQRHFKQEIDARRADSGHSDIVASLVQARLDEQTPLNDAEILSVLQALMVAGNETTTSTLAGGLLLLLRHPHVMGRLRQDPALIPAAVEEMLRFESPASGLWRIARMDTDLGGVPIPKGSLLNLRFAAANRDPAKFESPDTFNIDRKSNRLHIAFGRGPHVCIGNMLSRKELVIAFSVLLARFQTIELAAGSNDFSHHPNILARGLKALHIRVAA